ncbi:MAG: hypothetical protein H0T42_02515, partial [Deltaproteobacteria bacterium]|nr:hypothetical protein [Deltaproteobacteria bacterium]
MGVLRLLGLVVVMLATLVGASSSALAQRGVPQGGFPSWAERMTLVYVNRSRADPQADLAGCTVCAERACYPSAVTPVGYDFALNRASRFHSANLEITGTGPQTDSPCALLGTLSTAYVPTGTCVGAASCACVGGTLTGTTTFVQRIARFSALTLLGETVANVAATTPRTAFYELLWTPEASTSCANSGTNFPRFNILQANRRNVGIGYYRVANETWTHDFTSGTTVTGTLIAGGHEPQLTGSTVEFRTNYFDTGAPQAAVLNVDGLCSAMALERGSATNATYLASRTLAGTTCRRYRFEFIGPGGTAVVLPETGSYGAGGDATCADWTAAAPPVCGTNQTPTIATAASATPNPVAATTTQLSVLGADDAGEPALTYTWAVAGAAGVTIAPNGTNAAKTATATFATAGAYIFTVTVRDAGNLTTTSSVSVTVDQTLTTIAVAPNPTSVPQSATQQFTHNGLDQFGITMGAQPTVTWTVSGGGTISA